MGPSLKYLAHPSKANDINILYKETWSNKNQSKDLRRDLIQQQAALHFPGIKNILEWGQVQSTQPKILSKANDIHIL